MNNEVNQNNETEKSSSRLLLAPIISVAAFLIMIFGAGYAYFTATTQMNTATYQINMPSQTSLVCTKQDCGVTITPDQMTQANNSTTAKASNTCYLNCTCSGTQGAICNYNVTLANYSGVTPYAPTSGLGSMKEFTVQITGCTVQAASSETQVNSVVNSTTTSKVVSKCSLTVPAAGSTSASVSATFKWYNADIDQTSTHANHTYKYTLSTTSGTVG